MSNDAKWLIDHLLKRHSFAHERELRAVVADRSAQSHLDRDPVY
jgi:hypothetical protein